MSLNSVQNGDKIERIMEPIEHDSWSHISRQVRANLGLGREKFARLLQVSPRTVLRWENVEGEEPIIPQSVQRMKLLALYLNSNELEDQQAILADLLQQASSLRCQYERKATTIKEYNIQLQEALPAWFQDLCRLRAEQDWRAVLLMGPHFLNDSRSGEAGLIQAVLCLWIGNAAFMLGEPQRALTYYERALESESLTVMVKSILFSNKGYALIRLHQYEQADTALRESLRIDPHYRGALRNRLALHSLNEDENAAAEAALDLKSRYPEAEDPTSELGRLLLQDPDLRFFRGSNAFGRALPGLAQRSVAA